MYPTVSLQPGSTNTAAVKQLQDFLVSQGMMTQAQVNTGYGTYGPQTTAAVKKWQEANGVDNTTGPGYWGPKTIAVAKTKAAAPATTTQPPAGTTVNNTTNTTNTTTTGTGAPDQTTWNFVQNLINTGVIPNTPEMQARVNNYFGITSNTPMVNGQIPTSHYGATTTDQPTIASNETPALTELNAMAKVAGQSNLVNSNYLKNSIINNPSLMAFYVNALAWGDYTMGDILNDMKRREMADGGNTQAKNLVIIDPTKNKSTYMSTAEGQSAQQTTGAIIPTFNLGGLIDPSILKYGSNIPDEMFKTLVPGLDKNSQEFKDTVAGIKSMFFDLANAQLQATNEQEKSIADYNYEKFKESLDRSYNIKLSDSATKAWDQIQNLENTFNTRGIAGSGLQNEAIDNFLKTVRLTDQRDRVDKLVAAEAEQAKQMMNNATPEQLKAMDREDAAKGLAQDQWRTTKWGLKPTQDVLDQYSIANLKAKFPEKTDAELKAFHDVIIDENGNYRSAIYRTYYDNLNKNRQSEQLQAETTALQMGLDKESRAYADFDNSQPFSQPSGKDTVPGGATGISANAPGSTAPATATSGMSNTAFVDMLISQGAIKPEDRAKSLAAISAMTPTTTTQTQTQVQTPTPTGVPTGPVANESMADFITRLSKLGVLTPEQAAKAPGVIATLPKTPATTQTYTAPVAPKVSTTTQSYTPPAAPKVSTTTQSYTPPAAPVTPKVVTPTTIATPKKQYANLYDYYTGTTGSYNTWNSAQRLADAKKAGISNYTGTADQNTQLLKSLTA